MLLPDHLFAYAHPADPLSHMYQNCHPFCSKLNSYLCAIRGSLDTISRDSNPSGHWLWLPTAVSHYQLT